MAVRRVLDTNVALCLLAGRLAEPLDPAEYFVSVISELELLSYPRLTPAEEQHIHEFLDEITLVGLNAEVRKATIQLRRNYRLKLPDAIVCATAFVLDAELLTNDVHLKRITALRVSSVPLTPA